MRSCRGELHVASMPNKTPRDPCSACGGEVADACVSPERMFGLGGRWEYSECPVCGLLRLENPPIALDRFYPPSYYSFRQPETPRLGSSGRVLRRVRSELALRGGSDRFEWARWLRGAASTRSRILDYGSGNGALVVELRKQGFRNVIGYDPYAQPSEYVANVLPDGEFRIVMLHHVLEHLPEPTETLSNVHGLLDEDGRAIIRVPLADSFAWRRYRGDWIALDPPRHHFGFTETALAILAGQAGFLIEASWRDSDELQFWGSEQYATGLPLTHPSSPAQGGDLFSRDMAGFILSARNLNRISLGDTGFFRLRAL